MAQDSKIEWTHHTANIWWGCSEVHSGCDNCYARVLSNRWGEKLWGNKFPRRQIKSFYKDLNKYQRLAKEAGEIHRVFVGSMMDIFEKPMQVVDADGNRLPYTTEILRDEFFKLITDGEYDNLMFLFLTKRPSNINKYIPSAWKINPPKNVMFGTSPVNQKTAEKLIPQLLKVNGKRFLSVEPQLDDISFRWMLGIDHQAICDKKGSVTAYAALDGIDWVIQGGESGAKKRPFNLDWARKMRDQCKESHTPFFFKQIDKIKPIPEELMIRQFYK